MKQQLFELYQQHQPAFEALYNTYPTAKMSGPFLMSPGEAYINSKRKLLIVGQDTCGWGEPTKSISEQMAGYESFNLGKNYKCTPFWKMVRVMEQHVSGAHYTCAWANINRYDVNRKRPWGDYATAISQFDTLLLEESKIMKPDVCLFLTGYAFDDRLKGIFREAKFQSVAIDSKCVIIKIVHEALPKATYKIYHPGFLRRKKLEKVYREALITLIK